MLPKHTNDAFDLIDLNQFPTVSTNDSHQFKLNVYRLIYLLTAATGQMPHSVLLVHNCPITN